MTETKPIYKMVEKILDKKIESMTLSINGEPLSTKQLHEIIISQNMTIDRLLDDKSHYMDVVQKLYDDINKIKEMLIKCKFYEAWIEINKLID